MTEIVEDYWKFKQFEIEILTAILDDGPLLRQISIALGA